MTNGCVKPRVIQSSVMIHIEPTGHVERGKQSLACDLITSVVSPGSGYNLPAASSAPRTLWDAYKCYIINHIKTNY